MNEYYQPIGCQPSELGVVAPRSCFGSGDSLPASETPHGVARATREASLRWWDLTQLERRAVSSYWTAKPPTRRALTFRALKNANSSSKSFDTFTGDLPGL